MFVYSIICISYVFVLSLYYLCNRGNKEYIYGIKFIKHIHNNTSKRFYSFIDLVDKYNLPASDFLKYVFDSKHTNVV